jgi:hypothetical protein
MTHGNLPPTDQPVMTMNLNVGFKRAPLGVPVSSKRFTREACQS